MKIKMLKTYDFYENSRIYNLGEIIDKIEDNENSDFYHRWIKTHLDVIPKNICEKVK